MKITTVGIDLAKNVIQVHGVDARGKVALKKALKRELTITPPLATEITGVRTRRKFSRECGDGDMPSSPGEY